MTNLKIPSQENLLEAGAHLGHQTKRWHPKMAPYIYKAEKGVHLIDLFQTHAKLTEAVDFLFEAAKSGGQIIIVGTKGQAKEVVLEQSTNSGALYVNERWLGGTLTNFIEIKKRLVWLQNYDIKALGSFTKKERLLMSQDREITKVGWRYCWFNRKTGGGGDSRSASRTHRGSGMFTSGSSNSRDYRY